MKQKSEQPRSAKQSSKTISVAKMPSGSPPKIPVSAPPMDWATTLRAVQLSLGAWRCELLELRRHGKSQPNWCGGGLVLARADADCY
ncbi:MAG: hypothetical protein EXS15_03160 [Phycisphaerales bacterium]|nr:hypothetical protein [Phycisphaerales bacterium]